MRLGLSPQEEWILRYWVVMRSDERVKCGIPNSIIINGHNLREKSIGGKVGGVPPQDYSEIQDVLHRLQDYGFAKITCLHSGGVEYTVTKEGCEVLADIDNPDYFACAVEWARRNWYVAWGMIVLGVLGAIGGLIELVKTVLDVLTALYGH
jgi:hypothetical protein